MKVSIIIPIYNVAPYIERCLKSVMFQTYQNIEIILVNDCTPDNSMEIVKKIIESSFIKREIKIYSHKINKGLSAARNTGIKEAKGDYVYFLDSDDELPIHSIERLAKQAIKYNPDFVIGKMNVIGSFPTIPFLYNDIYVVRSNKDILLQYLDHFWYSMACNKLINKEFALNNNLFFREGLLHEDELWSFELALTSNSMVVYPEYTYNYYIREGSITKQIRKKNIDDLIFIYKSIFDLMINYDLFNNSSMICFLLNFKFNILLQTLDRQDWNDIYESLKQKEFGFFHVLKFNLGYKIKMKRILLSLPPFLMYMVCKVSLLKKDI